MEAKELQKKNATELDKLIDEFRLKIRDLRFKVTTRQVAKVRQLRVAKKDLAQALTELKSRTKI